VKDNDYIFDAYYNIGKLYYGLGLSEISLGYFLNLTKYDLTPINQCRVFYAVAEASRTSDTYGLDPEFYYKRGEAIAREINEPARVGDALFGQSQVYFSSLDIYTHKDEEMSKGKTDSLNRSISLLVEALAYIPDSYILNCALGLNYAAKKEFDVAEKYIRRGYELDTKLCF
jgi:tetratricopeptide (TPR) repeat protein